LLNEKVIDKPTYMESIVSKCIEQLLDLMNHVENVRIEERVLLNPHHGVKQCFHTMDVAVYDWATSEMVPAGPTSEKSASLMKNRVILVTKHCKKKKKRERNEKEGITVYFFPSPMAGLLLHHAMDTETASTKAKKIRT
jgi:hypothetical protein